MTTSRTAAIIWGSFALLALVLIAVGLCAMYGAPDAAYSTLGTVALSIGGSGGRGLVGCWTSPPRQQGSRVEPSAYSGSLTTSASVPIGYSFPPSLVIRSS
jgi:hypothetical protein